MNVGLDVRLPSLHMINRHLVPFNDRINQIARTFDRYAANELSFHRFFSQDADLGKVYSYTVKQPTIRTTYFLTSGSEGVGNVRTVPISTELL